GEAKEANGSHAGEVQETVLFSPPEEKLFFGDEDLDEPLAFVGVGKSALKETEINGVKCFAGEVSFTGPGSYWSLLNPFTKAKDAEGNTYWVRGLVGLCIVIEAAKRKEKLKVVCLKTGEKEYGIVRW
ncbi:MAG: hypothetical protein V1717_01780, partial [Candidatus Micrarchaeota archaeon]